jgi:hypothetical protein
MKHVFVRFVEIHEEPRHINTCANLLSGEAAESPEAFIKQYDSGVTVEVLSWFEVPQSWENIVGDGIVNDTLEAILALDALGKTPVVSDLLATIFEEGYELGQKKERHLATALRALLDS